jgi:hypothetical protein
MIASGARATACSMSKVPSLKPPKVRDEGHLAAFAEDHLLDRRFHLDLTADDVRDRDPGVRRARRGRQKGDERHAEGENELA